MAPLGGTGLSSRSRRVACFHVLLVSETKTQQRPAESDRTCVERQLSSSGHSELQTLLSGDKVSREVAFQIFRYQVS